LDDVTQSEIYILTLFWHSAKIKVKFIIYCGQFAVCYSLKNGFHVAIHIFLSSLFRKMVLIT